MIGAIGIEVFVANPAAGTDYECGTDLLDSRSGLVDVMPPLGGRSGRLPCARMKQLKPRERSHGGCTRCGSIIVNEHEERNSLLIDKGGGVTLVTGTDGDDSSTEFGNLVVVVAQLRGVLSAVQSTEVAKEHHHNGLIEPEIPKLVRHSRTIGQRERRKRVDVHGVPD